MLTKNQNGKYSVTTIFCDSGECIARQTLAQDKEGSFETFDCYIDEFNTLQDAQNFIGETYALNT